MKTQRNHFERQLQHSYELAARRANIQHNKDNKKYQMIGWVITAVWGVFTLVCYLIN